MDFCYLSLVYDIFQGYVVSALLDMLTHMDPQCMHRFCEECITRSLRLLNKECPTCRHVCPTRRSLREDTNFDQIISIICPDRESFDAKQEEVRSAV